MRLPLAGTMHGARPARSVWAVRMALFGAFFISVGAALVLGTLVVDPLRNIDVLSAGVTLSVAGGVLRSISSPLKT